MNIKKIGLLIVVISLISVVGYLYLGGAQSVSVAIKKLDGYTIIGTEYTGRYKSKEIETLFYTTKQLLNSDSIEGKLVVINYPLAQDSIEKGFVKQFIGIAIEHYYDYDKRLKFNYTIRKIDCDSILQASITSHNLVMPHPEKVEKKIAGFAKKNNLSIANFTIEKYVSDSELVIEVPVFE